MELLRAAALAEGLLVEHGLTGWTFAFDRARVRAGLVRESVPGRSAQARPVASPGSRRPSSATGAPRRPRPGVSRLKASSRLVLPAPLGPNSTVGPGPGSSCARS